MDPKYKGDHVCLCFRKLSFQGSRSNHSRSHRQWVQCRTLKPLRSYKVWEFLGCHLHVMGQCDSSCDLSPVGRMWKFVLGIWRVRLCLVIQSCPTLCGPMGCSPLGLSAHGILQARILERVAISFSRGSSQPRDWTYVSCTAGGFLTSSATWEAQTSGIWSNWRAPEATLNRGQNAE